MTDTIRPSPELAAIVERWIKAYGSGDGETVAHLFSDDAALSYFGSAQGESWRDDALRRGMAQYIGEVPGLNGLRKTYADLNAVRSVGSSGKQVSTE